MFVVVEAEDLSTLRSEEILSLAVDVTTSEVEEE